LVPFALFGADKDWHALTNCQLVASTSNDGDSFHVKHEGREYVFRLYFVDAPETSDDFPDRVQAQADYFGITKADALKVGKDAAAFTRKALAKPFTVLTRWQNALGRSEREYGIVTADGGDLAAALVSNGLARIHGAPVAVIGEKNNEQLRKLEADAKKAKRGAWGKVKQ
jgi:endonuclease YncB( thermonuclease family)